MPGASPRTARRPLGACQDARAGFWRATRAFKGPLTGFLCRVSRAGAAVFREGEGYG